MKGGPDLRLTSPVSGGAVSGRSAEGRTAKGAAEHSSSPFEMLFARVRPAPEESGAKGGMTREVAGSVPARSAAPRLDASAEAQADAVDAPEETSAAAEVVVLGPVPQGQNLAEPVAQQIAASLDRAQAKTPSAGAVPDVRPDRGRNRREAVIATDLALAVSTARRAETAGRPGAAGAPDLAVTRRETHFSPVLTRAAAPAPAPAAALAAAPADRRGAATSPGQMEDGPTVPRPAPAGSRLLQEPVAAVRGRAEQIMMAGRAAAVNARGQQAQTLAAQESKPARGIAAGTSDASPGAAFSATVPSGAGASAGTASAPSVAAPAGQPGAAAPAMPAAGGPVKVLHIQLQPAELGKLEVRMRLTDAGLEVHIRASRHETLALLKNDREALGKVLRGAGHPVDTVTVSFADKSGGAQGQPSQDGGQPSSGARSESQSGAQSGAQYGAQSGTPREQGGRPEDRFPSRPESGHASEKVHDDQDQPAVAARRNGDLYL